jgi:hypothetical protein
MESKNFMTKRPPLDFNRVGGPSGPAPAAILFLAGTGFLRPLTETPSRRGFLTTGISATPFAIFMWHLSWTARAVQS